MTCDSVNESNKYQKSDSSTLQRREISFSEHENFRSRSNKRKPNQTKFAKSVEANCEIRKRRDGLPPEELTEAGD